MFDQLPKEFGAVIKRHRQQRKWSQMKLAQEAGLHLNALGSLERGKQSPTLHTVFMLAKALNVPASKLVAATEFRLD